MIAPQTAKHPGITWFGLALALFGIPLAVNAFKLLHGAAGSDLQYLCKELLVFAVLAALLLIVIRGEKLPLTSIGLHLRTPWRSLLWGSIGVVLFSIGILGCFYLIHCMGWSVGFDGASAYQPPLWAVVITVLRAGIVEEVCYRGYAIERLQALTGNTWLAAGLPLLVFVLAHINNGPGGMLIALMGGVLLTALYVVRRDLLANIFTHVIVDLIANLTQG